MLWDEVDPSVEVEPSVSKGQILAVSGAGSEGGPSSSFRSSKDISRSHELREPKVCCTGDAAERGKAKNRCDRLRCGRQATGRRTEATAVKRNN